MRRWWKRLSDAFGSMGSWPANPQNLASSVVTAPPSKPEDVDVAANATAARLGRARQLWSEGRPDEALREIDGALEEAERPAEVHLELARAQFELKDLTAAIDALHLAVTLDPDLGPAWALLGTALSRLDRDVEAIEAFEQASGVLTGQPKAEALFGLANSLSACRRQAEALDAVGRSMAIDDSDWRPWALKGSLHYSFEDEPQALSAYARAVELCPHPPPSLLLQVGSLQQYAGRFEEAQRLFESIMERNPGDPQVRWYLAQCDLVQGRWERGWSGYAARFAAGASPYRPLPFPVWDGRKAPNDTLLILADQGLGDEIMFASCFREALQRVGHCIIECEPRLHAIFRRSFPEATVLKSQQEPLAAWLRNVPYPDWQIFGGDLPALYRRKDSDFGNGSAYLRPDLDRVAHWQQELRRMGGASLKVGLSWRGGTPLTRRKSRSISADELAPILRTPGCHFVNLQYGDCAGDIDEFEHRVGSRIHNHPEALDDYDETAALVMALDVVVTVCTAIVHLSGAMGQRTRVLVPASPGWRYTLGAVRLPWYGSVVTFRQPSPGDWSEPCTSVATHLAQLTQNVVE